MKMFCVGFLLFAFSHSQAAPPSSLLYPSGIYQPDTLHVANEPSKLVQYAGQGDLAMLDLLIASGVLPSEVEPKRRMTALHAAAAQGHLKIVSRLIRLGADVNAADSRGSTPLINACYGGHLGVVRALIHAGAAVNWVPREVPTALVVATQQGSPEVLHALLGAKAEKRLIDSFGTTAVDAAKRANQAVLLQKLELMP